MIHTVKCPDPVYSSTPTILYVLILDYHTIPSKNKMVYHVYNYELLVTILHPTD